MEPAIKMKRREFNQKLALAGGFLAFRPISALAQNLQNLAGGNAQTPASQAATSIARGTIRNAQTGEGMAKIRVSNGRDVVQTDRLGRYEIALQDGDVLFVVKPRGFDFERNALQKPQFFRVHRPGGSPKQQFAGIAPTGDLPRAIDFRLTPQKENDEFRVLLFGDPQSRNQSEVDFLTRDIIEPLVGVDAAFGVSLGDIAFDDLTIYANQNAAIGQIGLPWHNVLGNHDLNFDAPDRELSAETYKAIFGPTYYSFDYGPAHFVVLDDVAYDGLASAPAGRNKGTYHTELGEKQLAWLRSDLALVPKNQLVVFLMHIPMVALEGEEKHTMRDLPQFLDLISDRPHTLSISAHTHFQTHKFIGRERGFNGANPHHHFNCVTTCGSWWRGALDARGIPHTAMRDGAPNGYAFLNVNKNAYTLDFRAAGADESHQMDIVLPLEAKAGENLEILANVWNGSEKSKVEVRVNELPWRAMEQVQRPDPNYVACRAYEESLPKTAGRKLPAPVDCTHLWAAQLGGLSAGTHTLTVRETDMWNRVHVSRKILRVA